MDLTISQINMDRMKNLLNMVPDMFAHVPFKIGKDENENCFARIDATSINGDISFFGTVQLENIEELSESSMMAIRLQTNKSVVNSLFNLMQYDKMHINKSRILVESKNKKLSVQLYQLNEKDIYSLPENSEDMYNAVISNNVGLKDDGYIVLNLDNNELKDFIDSTHILSPSKPEDIRFNFKLSKSTLTVYSEDYLKNSIEFAFSPTIKDKVSINTKYDYNLTDIINKTLKFKDFDVSILMSNPVVSFDIVSEKNGITSTISVSAQKSD